MFSSGFDHAFHVVFLPTLTHQHTATHIEPTTLFILIHSYLILNGRPTENVICGHIIHQLHAQFVRVPQVSERWSRVSPCASRSSSAIAPRLLQSRGQNRENPLELRLTQNMPYVPFSSVLTPSPAVGRVGPAASGVPDLRGPSAPLDQPDRRHAVRLTPSSSTLSAPTPLFS